MTEGPSYATPGSAELAGHLKYVDRAALQSLAVLLFRPAEVSLRTLEYVDLSGELPVRKETREYGGLAGAVLVPIALPLRGELIDHIRIEGTDEVTPTVLSGSATTIVLSYLLQAMAATVDFLGVPRDYIDDVWTYILEADPSEGLAMLDQFRSIIRGLSNDGSVTSEQAWFLAALQLLARRRPLLVPVDSEHPVVKVVVERDLPHITMQPNGGREAIRALLGRLPDHVRFDCPRATRSQSYHFRLVAPSDYFIRSVACSRKVRTGIGHNARRIDYETLKEPQWIHGDEPNSSQVVHVHMRQLDSLPAARLGVVVEVRIAERPFGRLGSAAVRLAAIALVTIVIMLTGHQIVSASNAAIMSILLGLPALLGASLVSQRQVGLLRDVVLARVANAVAVLLALALSSGLFAWTVHAQAAVARIPKRLSVNDETAKLREAYQAPHGVRVYLAWVLIVAIVGAVWVIVSFTRNTYRYIQASRNSKRRS